MYFQSSGRYDQTSGGYTANNTVDLISAARYGDTVARARALPWRAAVRAECGGFEFKDFAAAYNLCPASTC
eukprot:6210938-Pleurochrysis_carterae.AAC.1